MIEALETKLREPVPKTFRGGTHRTVSPETTLARVGRWMPVMGITRLANITGLDRLGIPVVVACRPNSRSLAVAQGKGLDLAAAKASALMESVEAFHAETMTHPLKLASYEELRYTHRVIPPELLPRATSSRFHPDLSLLWVEGLDLIGGGRMWVPYELVHTNYTHPKPSGHGCFNASSNGLASGNHLLEAVCHGLCEVIERDATTLWYLRPPAAQQATRIDPASVDDAGCREVLDRYRAGEVDAAIWEITSDMGVPAFLCVISEGRGHAGGLHAAAGMGCHPVRSVALLRALTEAAQSRLTVIAGSRDDVVRADYAMSRSPFLLERQRAAVAEGATRRFADCPTYESESFNEDLAWLLGRLRAVGVPHAVAVDLTRPEFGVPVARVVVAGIEGLSTVAGYRHGPRAMRMMEARR